MTKTLHPAMRIAMDLYDEDRDLLDYEQDFLSAVHMTGTRRAETIDFATRNFGDLSDGYWAATRLADRQHAAELGQALSEYRTADARQYADEINLIDFHMSQAAE